MLRPRPPEREAARRVRDGPAPLRRRAAWDADVAADARGAARPHDAHRGHGRAADDALAGVGDAVGAGPAWLTSTRSTRSSSPTRTRRGRGCAATRRSPAAGAGASGR